MLLIIWAHRTLMSKAVFIPSFISTVFAGRPVERQIESFMALTDRQTCRRSLFFIHKQTTSASYSLTHVSMSSGNVKIFTHM